MISLDPLLMIAGAVAILLLGLGVGMLAGYLIASRCFDEALDQQEDDHYYKDIERNYNFLKMARVSDKPKNRHWNN